MVEADPISRFAVLGYIPMEEVERVAAMIEQAKINETIDHAFDRVCPLLDLPTGDALFKLLMKSNDKVRAAVFQSKSVMAWIGRYNSELVQAILDS